jgi:hypothetical protein
VTCACVIFVVLQVLRLRLPAEVKVSESKCQRAKVNGALLIVMPKVDPMENAISLRGDQRAKATSTGGGSAGAASKTASSAGRTVVKPKKLSLQEQIMLEAQAAAGGAGAENSTPMGRNDALLDANIGATKAGVNVANIVRRKETTPAEELAVQDTIFNISSRVVELD